ncbi:MAG TPA: hypothetical protein VMG99_09215 [Thermoplasmata archaeon]|jgi:hypothetical protein|nr:hypothetical protein [Thermoplasmata archaeon]
MIKATARVLKNVIEIQVGDELWLCRPVQWTEEGLGSRIAALFSTEYLTYRPQAPQEVHSNVTYRMKSDEIRISTGPDRWQTKSTLLGPMTLDYGGVRFTVNERLTGRFSILRHEEAVGVGQIVWRTCSLDDYPADLEVLFANLALGLLIRTLAWEGLR